MGDWLTGGVVSGTPHETRGGTAELASLLQRGMRGDTSAFLPFHRIGMQGFQSLFGMDPESLGIGEVLQELLAHPEDRTSGLFRSMEPFEARETERQASGMRDLFGTVGGRFGRNVIGAERELRGELGSQFQRGRHEALLEAGGQRAQTLFGLLRAITEGSQASFAPLEIMSRFFAPGQPMVREGALPGLLQLGATLGAMKMFPRD